MDSPKVGFKSVFTKYLPGKNKISMVLYIITNSHTLEDQKHDFETFRFINFIYVATEPYQYIPRPLR